MRAALTGGGASETDEGAEERAEAAAEERSSIGGQVKIATREEV
jgi:hypothetical protein